MEYYSVKGKVLILGLPEQVLRPSYHTRRFICPRGQGLGTKTADKGRGRRERKSEKGTRGIF